MSLQKFIYGAFQKVIEQDDGTIRIEGIASTPARDDSDEIITADAMRGAQDDYMKWGAIREMHGPSAAGTALAMDIDENGTTKMVVHIVDPGAIKKVQSGVYKGFSVGGKVLARDPKDRRTITKIKLIEVSLVDRPCNPEARLDMWKAADAAETLESGMPDVKTAGAIAPTNAEVRARAEDLCKTAGKPASRYVDYLAKGRDELLAEYAAGGAVVVEPETPVVPEAVVEPVVATDENAVVAEPELLAAAAGAEPIVEDPAAVLSDAIDKAKAAVAAEPDEPVVAKTAEVLTAELAAKDVELVAKNAEIEALTSKVLELETAKTDIGKAALAGAGEIGDLVKAMEARDTARDAVVAQLQADLAKFGAAVLPAKTVVLAPAVTKAADGAGTAPDLGAAAVEDERATADAFAKYVDSMGEQERGEFLLRAQLKFGGRPANIS